VPISIESRHEVTWRSNVENSLFVATLIKSKRNEATRINIVQAQVEEIYFTFILSIGMSLYQEGYPMDCQQSLNAHIA
jgi:hypothetical protein